VGPAAIPSRIEGVVRYPLEPHRDERGALVEIYRDSWTPNVSTAQWNYVRNRANVLRGFHCHVRHTDLLAMIDGSMVLGLKDLRTDSSTHDVSEVIVLHPAIDLVMIPPGVGHGFYFPEPAMLLNAVSHTWSKEDELGCRWDDPDLDLEWGCRDPVISERDRIAGSLEQLRAAVSERRTVDSTAM
jgi:dTDP-4-dehydrorhamnose 3,5-epimerase